MPITTEHKGNVIIETYTGSVTQPEITKRAGEILQELRDLANEGLPVFVLAIIAIEKGQTAGIAMAALDSKLRALYGSEHLTEAVIVFAEKAPFINFAFNMAKNLNMKISSFDNREDAEKYIEQRTEEEIFKGQSGNAG